MENKKTKVVYMRPSKILEAHPEIKKKWNANDLGNLLRMKLVRGYKLSRGSEISETDVIKLFNYMKTGA